MRIAIAALGILVFLSCRKKNDCNPVSESAYYKLNAQIDTSWSFPPGYPPGILSLHIGSGQKQVLVYQRSISPCELVYDGGSTQSLYLEVDPDATQFKYYNSDFSKAHCYYILSASWMPPSAIIPDGGLITGTKAGNNGAWRISFDIGVGTGRASFTGQANLVPN